MATKAKNHPNVANCENLNLTMNEYLPLRDVVFITLRQAILRGQLKPGQRLMEIQLAKQLGVSRTPVREAIRKLELEGLVVTIPRKGAEVAQITEKDLKDVIEVRCALEELAVELACERITSSHIVQLKEVVKDFEHLISKGDITELAESDVRFHDIIFASTQNQRLIQMISNLREQMYRYRLEYLKDFQKHSQLVHEHEQIIRNLQKHNVIEAKANIRNHIHNQFYDVIMLLKRENEEKGSPL